SRIVRFGCAHKKQFRGRRRFVRRSRVLNRHESPMDRSNITTAFDLPNGRVVRSLGIVRGITVRSRSIVGNFGAALQSLVGGNITLYAELCEKARAEAFDLMVSHAREIGA